MRWRSTFPRPFALSEVHRAHPPIVALFDTGKGIAQLYTRLRTLGVRPEQVKLVLTPAAFDRLDDPRLSHAHTGAGIGGVVGVVLGISAVLWVFGAVLFAVTLSLALAGVLVGSALGQRIKRPLAQQIRGRITAGRSLVTVELGRTGSRPQIIAALTAAGGEAIDLN